jgi:hypothetical protein
MGDRRALQASLESICKSECEGVKLILYMQIDMRLSNVAQYLPILQNLKMVTYSMSKSTITQLCRDAFYGAMVSSKLLQSMRGVCMLRCLSTGDCQRGGKRKLTKTNYRTFGC